MNTTLQILNISHNKISDDGTVVISECLKYNSTLQELNILHNKISNNEFAKALHMNTTLQLLYISHNKLSDNEVLTLSNHLKWKSKLYQLKMSVNDIDLNLNCIVGSLNACGRFHLKKFSNTEAILVSKFLYYNTNILKLDFSYNDISDDGAIAISECLKNNYTLQELNMSHNKVSDHGIINIGKALQINITL